ncbi:MAG: hypothetical protein AUI36_30190 [Cyanobacteria bacterium 13_1_40CM_2_61_4]|nr:MAG: hypothetical protein AUI36_30190 [Cyanobacteria bacterium 13_1_40CM_2_61_4]
MRRILIGPSAGQVYRIFPAYGLAPTFGRWEPELQKLMVKLIQPGDTAYDVGANYGIHSLLMSRLAGPAGTVCAFEPHPRIYASCAENMALNAITNIRLFNAALGEVRAELPYVEGHHDGAGHIGDDDNGSEITVSCLTIDELVSGHRIPKPDFIKIDVEGFEGRVLAGASSTVRSCHPTLAIDLHTPEQDVLVGRFMIDTGYEVYRQQGLQRITKLHRGWPDPDGIQGSVLAIHPSREQARARLFE